MANANETLRGYWMKFRKNVPGKVQLSVLLISIITGVALWAGWVDPGLDHFVIEVFIAVGLFVYAIFVALELDDHHDRTELLGVMLSYVLFNFYVSYNLTGQNTEIPIIGGQMAGAAPDLAQLGHWLVVVGVIGLIFNLICDRDTAVANLAWHWRNNPIVWLLRPVPRDFGDGLARLREKFPKEFSRPQLRRQPGKKPTTERLPDKGQREASSSE